MPAAGTSTSSSRIVVSGSLRCRRRRRPPVAVRGRGRGRGGAGCGGCRPSSVAVLLPPGRWLRWLALVAGPVCGPGRLRSCSPSAAGLPSRLLVARSAAVCWSPPWSLVAVLRRSRSCSPSAGRCPAVASLPARSRPAACRARGPVALRRSCASRLVAGCLRRWLGLLGPRLLGARSRALGLGSLLALSARRALAAALGGLDGLDELRLLHLPAPAMPRPPAIDLRSASSMELSPPPRFLPGPAASVGACASGGGFDGVRHVRSFPRISADPA